MSEQKLKVGDKVWYFDDASGVYPSEVLDLDDKFITLSGDWYFNVLIEAFNETIFLNEQQALTAFNEQYPESEE